MTLRVDDLRVRAIADELLRLVDAGDRARARFQRASLHGRRAPRAERVMAEVDAALAVEERRLEALRRRLEREKRVGVAL